MNNGEYGLTEGLETDVETFWTFHGGMKTTSILGVREIELDTPVTEHPQEDPNEIKQAIPRMAENQQEWAVYDIDTPMN